MVIYPSLKKSEVPELKQKIAELVEELDKKNKEIEGKGGEIKKLMGKIKSLEEGGDARNLSYVDARNLKTVLEGYVESPHLDLKNIKNVITTVIRKNIQGYSSGRVGKNEMNEILYGLDAGKSRLYKELGDDSYTGYGRGALSKLIRFLEGREEILKKTIEGKASWLDTIKIYFGI